jgi:hypothetical protein
VLKQLFHITRQPVENWDTNVLLIEAGEDYCCFAEGNDEAKILSEISYNTFDKFLFKESIEALLKSLKELDRTYTKVVLCTAFPQALLTPKKLYQPEESNQLLNVVYGMDSNKVMHDEIELWQIVNLYSVPQQLYEAITSHFPSATFIHEYTVALRDLTRFSDDDQIAVHCTSSSFRIKVKRGRQLLLVQTFTYSSPLDVVYVLLKVCSEFELQQETVHIILSGLIEEDSALYKEIYNYFLHLQFAAAPDNALNGHQYPQHYFTSLYNLAACVL